MLELGRLPLMLVVVTTLWWSRFQPAWVRRRYPAWVLLASAWVLGSALGPGLTSGLCAVIDTVYHFWNGSFGSMTIYLVVQTLTAGIMSTCLLTGSKHTRLIAVTLATIEIAAVTILTIWGLPNQVRTGIEALYLSVPFPHDPLPSPFPWGLYLLNSDSFRFLFIDTARQAGPWILIALFAGKYPMRVPPDDGSPFPRRYCGHCWYNLHGIDLSVCPECGRQLVEK